MLFEALGAVRDLGRLQEIAGVMIRHGLGDLVRRLGLADTLERAGRRLHWERASIGKLEPPVQVRLALEELGPTFVKLGQILAGRADLFGPEWIAEFERLHSRVPPLPLEALRAQLREDLGDEPEAVFAAFDAEPLAAGSIAQVHRAELANGDEVVVKIRRPGIRSVIEADLRLMAQLARVVEDEWPDARPYRPRELVRQFAASLRRELDLAAECRNAERIAGNLQGLAGIHVPRVYWDWTRERINVQQRIVGIPGEALAAVDQAGLDRRQLARRGAEAVLKMIVEDGLFHADPHPGNVIYLPGNELAFIDFGMVGRMTDERREELLQLLLGLVEKQPREVTEVLLDWTGQAQGDGDSDEAAVDQSRLTEEIAAFVDQYHGAALQDLNLGQMLGDVTTILREHQLALPPDLALLIKTFISLEGMGRALDPQFHMAQAALPMLQATMRQRYAPRALAQRAWTSLRRSLSLLEQLPQDLSSMLRKTRRGGVRVHVEVRHLKRVGDQLDRAANRLTMGIVIAALIIGSSIVMTVRGGPTLFGLPAFGLFGFCVAMIGGVWLLRSIWRSHRQRYGDLP